ncbi:MAG: heavy metal translocating P-type ATPase, partial [Pseudomonadales bacterium]|nr:heavy metal translocating P-type ATPase [Pseudomonadales bacterium]
MTSACFHCALPVPLSERYSCNLLGQERLFCCAGCQAVAQTIVACGCADYYQHRLQPATSFQALAPELPDLAALDHPAVQADYVQHQGSVDQAELTLAGLTCTACSWLIEHRLMQLPGIEQVAVNFSTQRLLVRFDERTSPSKIVAAIRDIGYQARPYVAYEHEILLKKTARTASRRLALAGLGAMQAMMFALGLYLGERQGMSAETRDYLRLVTFLVSTPVVIYAGWPFYRQAAISLRHRHLSMDVPLTLAVLSAYLASTWAMITHRGDTYFDSISMLIFFVTASRYLETRARLSAGEIHANIQALTPKLAWLVENEQTQRVASASLKVGDKVRVLPGESLPCDGKIISGHTLIGESLLTGESLPLEKGPNDLVIAGSQNLEQTLTLEVTAVGTATVLAGLERLLNRAQAEKPHAAQLADRVAAWLIAGILVATVATYTYWHVHHSEHAFWYALAVLIVTCPCALALAVPAAWTISTTTLAKQGFLIGRGHVLETLQNITTVLFDKTGT